LIAVNRVLLLLCLTLVVGAFVLNFVTLAPNRLASGQPIMLMTAEPQWLLFTLITALIIFIGASLKPIRFMSWLVLLSSITFLLILVFSAGDTATHLRQDSSRSLARVSLGSGFWLILSATSLIIIDSIHRLNLPLLVRAIIFMIILSGLISLGMSGHLNMLSLAQEYFNRQDVFISEVIRHGFLVVAALIPSLIIGSLMGLWAFRVSQIQSPLFSLLNLLQTIPSIAMFGLLMAPLTSLTELFPFLKNFGIRGVGVTPAIIALTLYALLPVARNTLAGFLSAPHSAIDAARGMGMKPRELIWYIVVPLALPTLLAGIRIVTVQLIGLSVVAGLIGAGGLGSFVFQGIGQTAADLVLLGVLPVLLMALCADLIFGFIITAARHA
jgi:osmoprotectant transport system permease protein